MVRDTVLREPVSGVIFPDNRELTGKFHLFRASWSKMGLQNAVIPGLIARIPYSK